MSQSADSEAGQDKGQVTLDWPSFLQGSPVSLHVQRGTEDPLTHWGTHTAQLDHLQHLYRLKNASWSWGGKRSNVVKVVLAGVT